jgi:hypothetical protein
LRGLSRVGNDTQDTTSPKFAQFLGEPVKEKTTLPIMECGGSEYEIGRHYGEQARDSLQSAVGLMYRSMQLMPYQAGREAVVCELTCFCPESALSWIYKDTRDATSPRFQDEMKT